MHVELQRTECFLEGSFQGMCPWEKRALGRLVPKSESLEGPSIHSYNHLAFEDPSKTNPKSYFGPGCVDFLHAISGMEELMTSEAKNSSRLALKLLCQKMRSCFVFNCPPQIAFSPKQAPKTFMRGNAALTTFGNRFWSAVENEVAITISYSSSPLSHASC